jgi:hypothetical protein
VHTLFDHQEAHLAHRGKPLGASSGAHLVDGRPRDLQEAVVRERQEDGAVQQEVEHDGVADAPQQLLPLGALQQLRARRGAARQGEEGRGDVSGNMKPIQQEWAGWPGEGHDLGW